MQAVRNLPIGVRLSAGFALVLAGIVAMGVVGWRTLLVIEGEFTQLTKDNLVKVLLVRDSQDNINLVARGVRNIALYDSAKVREAEMERIRKARAENAEIFAKLDKMITSAKGRELLKAMNDERAKYAKALDGTLELFLAGKTAEGKDRLLGELRQAQAAYFAANESVEKFQMELMQKAADDVAGAVDTGELSMLLLALAAIAIGVTAAWWITRTVTAPVAQAVKLAETIAAGDLTAEVKADSTDEIGHLLSSMQRMNESLRKIVAEVRAASDSIATGSSQIATGTQDLSSRTEEQASNLEQTAASMEQLTASVKQSAENARQANQLAANASTAAASGGEVVGKVVETMENITTQSHKIAEIITVIDGIAFQTNILALNAAVEAARAGEQGRGFAVVASEVRALAQRSANAAREIKTLINASVEQIENGGVLVHQAGDRMNEIVGQVRHVTSLIAEITAATVEEGTGIGQVTDAVSQLDQVTQQNAALVEESAAAADSLKNEAERLTKTVSVFRVPGGPGARVLPA